ncbi:MAG TPA: LCP family protein [Patescibacteria group bacterium]|nr:LCP family protein [Patescibacteria group bacterium]
MKIRLLIYCLLVLLIFGVSVLLFVRPYDLFLQRISGTSLTQLIFEKGSFKNMNGKVNVLLLGKAGGEYEGADLTDSIIVMSIDTRLSKIITISIPRDIWSNTLQDKINTAYYYGKNQGKDFEFTKNEIELVTGMRIDYVALIDFDQFEELTNYIGGVDIFIENTFDDFKYPIAGRTDDRCSGDRELTCRYEHISFTKGLTHMDGKTALKYSRSRNAAGDEGTDFARGRRQQKVITALYEKIIQRIKKIKIEDIENIYGLVHLLVERDIENKEALYLVKTLVLTGKKIDFHEISLPKDLFIVPFYQSYNGKYVLIPKDGNFNDVHSFIQCSLEEKKNCEK